MFKIISKGRGFYRWGGVKMLYIFCTHGANFWCGENVVAILVYAMAVKSREE